MSEVEEFIQADLGYTNFIMDTKIKCPCGHGHMKLHSYLFKTNTQPTKLADLIVSNEFKYVQKFYAECSGCCTNITDWSTDRLEVLKKFQTFVEPVKVDETDLTECAKENE